MSTLMYKHLSVDTYVWITYADSAVEQVNFHVTNQTAALQDVSSNSTDNLQQSTQSFTEIHERLP